MQTFVSGDSFSQKKDHYLSYVRKEELTRNFLTWYTLSAGAKSCNIKKVVRITITCRAGVDILLWEVDYLVLQKFKIQADLCLRNSIVDLSQLFKN